MALTYVHIRYEYNESLAQSQFKIIPSVVSGHHLDVERINREDLFFISS